MSPTISDLSPEDRAFVAEYEGGLGAKCEAILSRWYQAHPEALEHTRAWLAELKAEAVARDEEARQ